jgi:hypothetical protein
VNFEIAVLKQDKSKVVRMVSTHFLRKKNNVGLIDWTKISGKDKKTRMESRMTFLTRS